MNIFQKIATLLFIPIMLINLTFFIPVHCNERYYFNCDGYASIFDGAIQLSGGNHELSRLQFLSTALALIIIYIAAYKLLDKLDQKLGDDYKKVAKREFKIFKIIVGSTLLLFLYPIIYNLFIDLRVYMTQYPRLFGFTLYKFNKDESRSLFVSCLGFLLLFFYVIRPTVKLVRSLLKNIESDLK